MPLSYPLLPLWLQGVSLDLDDGSLASEDQKEKLQEIISNSKLSEGYLTLARDLDVMEPKTPEDIYKVCVVLGHRLGVYLARRPFFLPLSLVPTKANAPSWVVFGFQPWVLSRRSCFNFELLSLLQAHLVDGRAGAGASVDSARQNLAATFVNAFVNAGFGQVIS